MLHWLKYPFVRIVIAFMTGILLADIWDISNGIFLIFGLILALVIIVSRTVLRRKFFSLNPFIGLAFLLLVLYLGLLRTTLYKREYSRDCISEKTTMYTGTVVSSLEFTGKNYKAILSVDEVNDRDSWSHCTGKVIIYASSPVLYGDRLIISSPPSAISGPANPLEFDYRRYMLHKNIRFRQFLSPEDYMVFETSTPSYFRKWGNAVQETGIQTLNGTIPEANANSIAKALLLGVRSNINDELQEAYAHAGVIHVLAISGLHLGIIYGLLVVLFGRFKKKLWFVGLTIVVLWSYAFVAGLPSSVTRAALMFSVLSIGGYFYKTPNIFNTLALSAFILLFINPFQLFTVGFQLSYLAVLGIIILYPVINGIFATKFEILERVWSLTSIGIAAQVFTFPLVIYYFHNFPLLFFVSNLIIIPLATIVLIGGLVLLLLMQIGFVTVAHFLGVILQSIIGIMNKSVSFIENVPGSFISDIFLDDFQVILLFVILVAALSFYFLKNIKWLGITFLAWVLLFTSFAITTFNRRDERTLVLYRISGVGVIDLFENSQTKEYIYLKGDKSRIDYHIRNFRLKKTGSFEAEPMLFVNVDLPGKLVMINNWSLLIVDQPLTTGKSFIKPIQVHYLVISANALKDFSKFRDQFDAEVVLIDTSNDFWYAKWAEGELNRKGINCYNVWSEGAYIATM